MTRNGKLGLGCLGCVGLIVFGFVGLVLIGLVSPSKPSAKKTAEAKPVILCRVTSSDGKGTALVSIMAGGQMTQHNGVSLPFESEYSGHGIISASAQHQKGYGDIRIQILVNGVVEKESSSTGEYAIASVVGYF